MDHRASAPASLCTIAVRVADERRALLTLDPAREATAIVSIVHAATFCRFEVTDPAADEVVLMCILQLLVTCVQCPSGGALSDEAVCEVVHSCFRISSQVTARSRRPP